MLCTTEKAASPTTANTTVCCCSVVVVIVERGGGIVSRSSAFSFQTVDGFVMSLLTVGVTDGPVNLSRRMGVRLSLVIERSVSIGVSAPDPRASQCRKQNPEDTNKGVISLPI